MTGEVRCEECGGTVPESMALELGGRTVCAKCKPAVARELAGAGASTSMRYAGFWIRFAAVFLDGVILFLVNFVLMLPFAAAAAQDPGVAVMANVVWMAFGIAYYTFFFGRYGATPGKMAVGVKVVRSDGTSITYLRGFARYWAYLLSSLTLLIGFIIAAFDGQKRALHDHVCDTRVVYK